MRLKAFTRQIDGEEAVIGLPAKGVFLSIPLEALDFLDQLAAGRTIGEAAEAHARKFGETPDAESLLAYLEARGFVDAGSGDGAENQGPAAEKPKDLIFHFAEIPESLARKVFSRPALIAAGAIIALGILAAILEPSLRPSWRFLYFEQNVTVMTSLLMAAGLLVTAVHEMGHLMAARARGVSCRLGIGHRMWMLVAETDMTGVWALPRKERFLPILAGPLMDALSGAVILLALFCETLGWLELALPVRQFLRAMLMIYTMSLLWQFYFFVRTDLYYVYTTTFSCKNLMKDTKDLLRNRWARLWGRPRPVDQSHIPSREMRAIGIYSGFWLIGRTVAYTVLFVFILPLVWTYFVTIARTLISTDTTNTYQLVDTLVFGAISFGILLLGLGLWGRSIYQNWRWQRAMAHGNSPARV